MKNNYLCIDGGTTNTRITAVINGVVNDREFIAMGSKDNIGSRCAFKAEIKRGIDMLISRNSLNIKQFSAVIASGMITSEYGLKEVPHIKAPAGIKELKKGLVGAEMGDISAIPFYFVPGVIVKNGECDTDMMRGEETEIIGLLSEYSSDCAFLLPGSHSKLITLDSEGKIENIKTFLSGEMLSAIAQNTVLKGTVDIKHTDFDGEYLLKGYEASRLYGLNEALFKTRILKNIFKKSPLQCYSFFLGAVFACEIEALKKSSRKKVVIGGRSALKNPICYLLEKTTDLTVLPVGEDLANNCTAVGAVKIFEFE